MFDIALPKNMHGVIYKNDKMIVEKKLRIQHQYTIIGLVSQTNKHQNRQICALYHRYMLVSASLIYILSSNKCCWRFVLTVQQTYTGDLIAYENVIKLFNSNVSNKSNNSSSERLLEKMYCNFPFRYCDQTLAKMHLYVPIFTRCLEFTLLPWNVLSIQFKPFPVGTHLLYLTPLFSSLCVSLDVQLISEQKDCKPTNA